MQAEVSTNLIKGQIPHTELSEWDITQSLPDLDKPNPELSKRRFSAGYALRGTTSIFKRSGRMHPMKDDKEPLTKTKVQSKVKNSGDFLTVNLGAWSSDDDSSTGTIESSKSSLQKHQIKISGEREKSVSPTFPHFGRSKIKIHPMINTEVAQEELSQPTTPGISSFSDLLLIIKIILFSEQISGQ